MFCFFFVFFFRKPVNFKEQNWFWTYLSPNFDRVQLEGVRKKMADMVDDYGL